MTPLFITLLQFFFILLIAPLSFGVVKKVKAYFQGRHGASVFLPYYSLLTLMKKQMVISKSTSWVFRFVPYITLTVTLFLVLVLPIISTGGILSPLSNFVLVAALLAVYALFLVLGGLDSASAFGGMGSSREMTITSLVEPSMIIVFLTFAVISGSQNIDQMVGIGGANILQAPFLIFTLLSLGLIALAENARYPVDNPATHLELTMVHEAMVLEYSGPYLAYLEYASMIKLTFVSLLLSNFLFPYFLITPGATFVSVLTTFAVSGLKLIGTMALLGFLESSIAKMRFYRLQEYFTLTFFLAFTGLILSLISLV